MDGSFFLCEHHILFSFLSYHVSYVFDSMYSKQHKVPTLEVRLAPLPKAGLFPLLSVDLPELTLQSNVRALTSLWRRSVAS